MVEAADKPADAAVAVLGDAEVILPLEGLIDKEAEAARLRKDLANAEKQVGPIEAKLSNEAFLSRAPADVVAGLRAKLEELIAQRDSIRAAAGVNPAVASARRLHVVPPTRSISIRKGEPPWPSRWNSPGSSSARIMNSKSSS